MASSKPLLFPNLVPQTPLFLSSPRSPSLLGFLTPRWERESKVFCSDSLFEWIGCLVARVALHPAAELVAVNSPFITTDYMGDGTLAACEHGLVDLPHPPASDLIGGEAFEGGGGLFSHFWGVYYYFYQIFRDIAEVVALNRWKKEVGDGSVGMLQSLVVASLSGLGLALNFSVFYFEILNSSEKACMMAKQNWSMKAIRRKTTGTGG